MMKPRGNDTSYISLQRQGLSWCSKLKLLSKVAPKCNASFIAADECLLGLHRGCCFAFLRVDAGPPSMRASTEEKDVVLHVLASELVDTIREN